MWQSPGQECCQPPYINRVPDSDSKVMGASEPWWWYRPDRLGPLPDVRATLQHLQVVLVDPSRLAVHEIRYSRRT